MIDVTQRLFGQRPVYYMLFALPVLIPLFLLQPSPAAAQFVCQSSTGAQGADATGSIDNAACGSLAVATGSPISANTAFGVRANAGGLSSSNTANGHAANASGDTSLNTAIG